MDENTTIIEEIRTLLSAPADDDQQPSLERLEHTLTTGYARALALEAESWRLERRIGEVMSDTGESRRGAAKRARELEELARKRTTAEYDLTHLRDMLSTLRSRASDMRATGT